jgi:hypothetical protein
MKFQFVHIPKTGGCSVIGLLIRNYPESIETLGHEFKVETSENPIVVVREPLDRISSVYQFWNKGSEVFDFDKNLTFDEFILGAEDLINSIPKEESDLATNYGIDLHILPQTRWLDEECYSKTIVIRYEKDLKKSIARLIDFLGLEDRSDDFKTVNVTKDKAEMNFSDEQVKAILKVYADDFRLWRDINRHPEKFRKVI